jgi:putative transposase
MQQLSFKRHRSPPDIIRYSVWLYARFTLSYRDVEEMLAERGLDVSYETIRRWFLKFGSVVAANLRRARPRPSDHWHLDEMVIVIQRKRYWLWRAVDNEGEVLDFLVQSRRDAKAAKKLMKKLLKKQGFAPTRIVTDKLRSYPSAFRAIGLIAAHDRGLRANNRAEGAVTLTPTGHNVDRSEPWSSRRAGSPPNVERHAPKLLVYGPFEEMALVAEGVVDRRLDVEETLCRSR